MYDFLRTVYPAVDADRCIDATFESAGASEVGARDGYVRAWLFRESRELIRGRVTADWLSRNFHMVRSELREQNSRVDDSETRTDVIRVTNAFAALSDEEQELLLISAAVGADAVDELAIVVGVTAEQAAARLQIARDAMRLAYEHGDPIESSEGDRS